MPVHKGSRSDDLHTTIARSLEECPVSTHDNATFSSKRTRKEFIIVRVATYLPGKRVDLDDMGVGEQQGQKGVKGDARKLFC